MPTFEMMKYARCGLKVRRKRVAQRYCSEHCRNAAVKQRQRARNTSSGPIEDVGGLKEARDASRYLEAVTSSQAEAAEEQSVTPQLQGGVRVLRNSVVNLTGRSLPRELLSEIIRTEVGSNKGVADEEVGTDRQEALGGEL